MQDMVREMERTTFVKKVITDLPGKEVLAQATVFFKSHGYRATPGGAPNTVRLMGRNEGTLPAVIGEIGVRTTNRGRTIVSFSGYGEGLNSRLQEFHEQMRAARKPQAMRPAAPVEQAAESRAQQLEEQALEQAEAAGLDGIAHGYRRDRFESESEPEDQQ